MFYLLHRLNPEMAENTCTFWRNDSVKEEVAVGPNGAPIMVPKPQKYW